MRPVARFDNQLGLCGVQMGTPVGNHAVCSSGHARLVLVSHDGMELYGNGYIGRGRQHRIFGGKAVNARGQTLYGKLLPQGGQRT